MKKLGIIAFVFSLAGCDGGPSARLAPGTEALLRRDPAKVPREFEDVSRAVLFELGESNHVEFAPLGTRVRVVSDDARPDDDERIVTVMVLEGAHARSAWGAYRHALAPVRRN